MERRIFLESPLLDEWLLDPEGKRVPGKDKNNKDVVYVIERLLGVGGKGAVFTAYMESDPSRNIRVLKFPTFDFTYIDPDSDVKSSLDGLSTYLNSQEAEYKEEYVRSQKLLDGCNVAHKTEDLIKCTYNFRGKDDDEGDIEFDVPVRIGVQNYLNSSEWKPVDELFLRQVNNEDLELDTLPEVNINYDLWFQLADGIGHSIKEIHDRRVVHGDVWAPNVFIRVKDDVMDLSVRPILIDFGNSWSTEYISAKLGGARTDAYAPPEEKRAILPKNEASDVFGFGVLLLWLLTGPDVGNRKTKQAEKKRGLLLAYLRRKAFDKKVKEIFTSATLPSKLQYDDQSALVNGLAVEQIAILKKHLPDRGADVYSLEQKLDRAKKDEEILREHLQEILVEGYILQGGSDLSAQNDRAKTRILEWTLHRWLKRRLYRPCETMIYDPGEISIKDASSQRKAVRDKILSLPNAAAIYVDHPWIVDLIARCVSSDQARRPRIIDVLRDLETYNAERNSADPLQAVSRHRLKVLNIEGVGTPADVSELDLVESRDVLIEYMSVCLRALRSGDLYAAVTTLDMWQKDALGRDGRLLTANLEALRAGVSIRRLFIISIDELGSRFMVRLLIMLAKEIGLHVEQRRGHRQGEMDSLMACFEDIKQPSNFTPFAGSNCPEEKRRAFASLLHHLRTALHDQLQFTVEPMLNGTAKYNDEVYFAHSQRVSARKRFKSILEGYNSFTELPGANLTRTADGRKFEFYRDQILPTEVEPSSALEGGKAFLKETPGLLLGLRIESSLLRAIKVRASCPRSIIRSRSVVWPDKVTPKFVMLETEMRGRSREDILQPPELNRIRMFHSKLEKSATVRAFQRIFYGFDRITSLSRNSSPLPVVNLGCLLKDLVTVLGKIKIDD